MEVVKELIVGNVTPKRIVGTWRLAQLDQWLCFFGIEACGRSAENEVDWPVIGAGKEPSWDSLVHQLLPDCFMLTPENRGGNACREPPACRVGVH